MEALNARINEAEERTSDKEDKMMKNKAEKKRDKQLLDHEGRNTTAKKKLMCWTY